MSFPDWLTTIGRFPVKIQDWGETGYAYKGYAPRMDLHTTETTGFPDYAAGKNQPHLTIKPVKTALGLEVRQHQSLNIGARALLGVSTNTANAIQVEQVMYSDRDLARSVGGLWVGSLSAAQLATLGEFYVALCALCGIPPVWVGTRGRLTQEAWLARVGWGVIDHARTPQNSHWDCGELNIFGALADAGSQVGEKVGGQVRPNPGPASASKYPRHGLTYAEVKSVQRACNQWFGATLEKDGAYGPATTAAVKAAQGVLGVDQDGIWGDGTQAAYDAWRAKKRAPVKFTAPKLRKGSRGKAVTHLQAGFLRVFGSYAGPIKKSGGADGKFGTGTELVVQEFQCRVGLTPDGVVGPKTWAKLGRWHINP